MAELYRGNVNLKNADTKTSFTQDQVIELTKISSDPIYFINTYCKVVSIDKGIVPFTLYPFQEQMIRHFHGIEDSGIINPDWRFSLCLAARQMGKTMCSAAYILWFAMTNSSKSSLVLSNKASSSREILDRIKLMYEFLPSWMKPGIIEWNKSRVQFDNKSKIITAATSANAGRSGSYALLYIDEISFVNRNTVEEFWTSAYPTISSGKESRIIISTTPNGYDFFYKLWKEAEAGTSEFRRLKFDWSAHPARDKKWYDTQIRNIGEEKFDQEFGANFLGASDTLISSSKLYALATVSPIRTIGNLKEYFNPIPDHQYVMTVDVSRGANLDYSTFTIFDISIMPYEVVSTFRDNTISTLVFPEIIFKSATKYNSAFVLIETNDLGQQVADTLFYDLEYENVYMTVKEEIKEGGGKNSQPGCRTTTRTKAVGCDILKGLIENDSLMVNDSETITELSTFIRKGKSYCADDQKHDDMVMTHVMFAYLTTQPVFKDLFDYSLREQLYKRQLADIDEQMLPLGYVNRGDASKELETIVIGTDVWQEWGEGQDLYAF